MTTLGLGGSARFFGEANSEAQVVSALQWATDRDVDVVPMGGGSNVIVSDDGFNGLILRIRVPGLQCEPARGPVEMVVGAGEAWDAVVAHATARNLAGIECLSGIPGWTGATPIQNVGAYGQEVADVLMSVRVLDRATLTVDDLPPEACAFSYRDSRFKREPDRWIVLGVRLRLQSGGAATLRYQELRAALSQYRAPSVAQVRDAVLQLRRRKSMVVDHADPDSRSAGSFFMNPIVEPSRARDIAEIALKRGWVAAPEEVPQYPVAGGKTKLAAGWLIERAGFAKGTRRGPIGISRNHALALVHHGGGTTKALLSFAAEIRDRVHEVFGVELVPEPVMLGVALPPLRV